MSKDDEKMKGVTISALLEENRVFPPPAAFKAQALIKDEEVYQAASKDREAFWAERARKLDWYQEWDKVLEWNPPHAKWFVGGKLNASYNCLDRHVKTSFKNKAAIIWEGEPGEQRTLTYWDLYRDVNKFANVLDSRLYTFSIDQGPVVHSDWYTENKSMWREKHPWRVCYEDDATGYYQSVNGLLYFQ